MVLKFYWKWKLETWKYTEYLAKNLNIGEVLTYFNEMVALNIRYLRSLKSGNCKNSPSRFHRIVGAGKFCPDSDFPISAEQSRMAGLFRITTLSSGSRTNRKSGNWVFGSEIEKTKTNLKSCIDKNYFNQIIETKLILEQREYLRISKQNKFEFKSYHFFTIGISYTRRAIRYFFH